jgi:ABC-type polysaccharide/polyol phosphate transport system ATPase subunit
MSALPAPPAIEVEGLRKYFTVPGAESRMGALARILHPVQRGGGVTLRVLDGISFDVARGELLGVIGRNGSGKTTLLRILGSIYRPDGGRVRIAGRVGPFLDLGVGFQSQMSARQNVAMNGILLGRGRREVKRSVDEVIDYAELRDFADAQLKTFSSGMRARLAFASMRQADPDIYLVDEILAAGDEAFREKCDGEFARLKERGKTIVMVSHGKGALKELADRTMLLSDGKIGAIGDTEEVFNAYRADRLARKEAARVAAGGEPAEPTLGDEGPEEDRRRRGRDKPPRATIERLVLNAEEDAECARIASREAIHLNLEVSASGWVKGPTLELAIATEDGAKVFVSRDCDLERLPVLRPGQRLVAEATLANSLMPGRYRLECVLTHGDNQDRSGPVSRVRAIDFEVEGDPGDGLVALERNVVLSRAKALEPV